MPTHHKLFLVELGVFVARHRDGDSLLVRVVVARLGRNIVSRIQTVGLLWWHREHGQHQLPFSGSDQVHHLLVGRSLHIHSITVGKDNPRQPKQKQIKNISVVRFGLPSLLLENRTYLEQIWIECSTRIFLSMETTLKWERIKNCDLNNLPRKTITSVTVMKTYC